MGINSDAKKTLIGSSDNCRFLIYCLHCPKIYFYAKKYSVAICLRLTATLIRLYYYKGVSTGKDFANCILPA